MTIIFAFICGMGVMAASILIPHARNPRSSVEEFQSFQNILSALPVAQSKKQQRTH